MHIAIKILPLRTGLGQCDPIRSNLIVRSRSISAMNKHSHLQRYGLAVIACGVALALARPSDAPSSCFILAIIVSGLFGGKGPGVLAVGISAIAFNFLFLPAPLSISSPSSSYFRFGVFVVTALTTSQLIETKRRIEESRRRIDETLTKTQARLSRATQIATVAEFAASIAHEISQPLSAVVANGQACLQWLSAEQPNLSNARGARGGGSPRGNG